MGTTISVIVIGVISLAAVAAIISKISRVKSNEEWKKIMESNLKEDHDKE